MNSDEGQLSWKNVRQMVQDISANLIQRKEKSCKAMLREGEMTFQLGVEINKLMWYPLRGKCYRKTCTEIAQCL